MTKVLVATALLTLTGCASGLNRVQADCEAASSTFPALASCLRATYRPSTARMHQYLATADHLAGEVRAGRISDSRARMELAQLRAAIAAGADADFDRALRRHDESLRDATRESPATTTTDCYRDSLGVSCTSRTR